MHSVSSLSMSSTRIIWSATKNASSGIWWVFSNKLTFLKRFLQNIKMFLFNRSLLKKLLQHSFGSYVECLCVLGPSVNTKMWWYSTKMYDAIISRQSYRLFTRESSLTSQGELSLCSWLLLLVSIQHLCYVKNINRLTSLIKSIRVKQEVRKFLGLYNYATKQIGSLNLHTIYTQFTHHLHTIYTPLL